MKRQAFVLSFTLALLVAGCTTPADDARDDLPENHFGLSFWTAPWHPLIINSTLYEGRFSFEYNEASTNAGCDWEPWIDYMLVDSTGETRRGSHLIDTPNAGALQIALFGQGPWLFAADSLFCRNGVGITNLTDAFQPYGPTDHYSEPKPLPIVESEGSVEVSPGLLNGTGTFQFKPYTFSNDPPWRWATAGNRDGNVTILSPTGEYVASFARYLGTPHYHSARVHLWDEPFPMQLKLLAPAQPSTKWTVVHETFGLDEVICQYGIRLRGIC